jgi:large subunit ribosomal protein L4
MADITLSKFDLTGKSNGTITLDPTVFGVTAHANLIHQVVVTQLANSRSAIAHVKDRGEVSGGGKKPWRQKGTGNARAGSSRSPLWRGGGITFGPSNERNFSKRLPQKMRQLAFKAALSDKVANKHLIVVTSLDDLKGKTKDWMNAYRQLPEAIDGALVISRDRQPLADRAIRNVSTHQYTSAQHAKLYDVMRHTTLVLTEDAVAALTEQLSAKTSVAAPVAAGKEKS